MRQGDEPEVVVVRGDKGSVPAIRRDGPVSGGDFERCGAGVGERLSGSCGSFDLPERVRGEIELEGNDQEMAIILPLVGAEHIQPAAFARFNIYQP